MKKEFREVTIKQEVYIADDGREFMDEEDCEEYEFKCLEQSLKLYNCKCKKVNSVDECHIANLVTTDDVKNFIKACDIYDVDSDGIDMPGVYIYDGFNDIWLNIEGVLLRIKGGVEND